MKDYYALLEVEPTASAEDVKRAFRHQIARYHPDKVQHLGKEFQDMAAGRAAELTEAYRILSDAAHRAEYDQARGAAGVDAGAPPPSPAPPPAGGAEAPPAPTPSGARPASGAGEGRAGHARAFSEERASRDTFVRRAALSRFQQALTATTGGGYDQAQVRGFDVACVPKARLFGRNKGARLLGRFVSVVDAAAVADAWAHACKWNVPEGDEVCVMLMGSGMAPARELADAIHDLRRRPGRGARVTLIPIDARNWDAHMPTDAPTVAKNLLARLRAGG